MLFHFLPGYKLSIVILSKYMPWCTIDRSLSFPMIIMIKQKYVFENM